MNQFHHLTGGPSTITPLVISRALKKIMLLNVTTK